MKKLILFFIIILFTCTFNVYADTPLEILKEKIDKVFSILNDPAYSDKTKKDAEHDKLWEIFKNAFDFKSMSRLALGANWRSFSKEEQNEFASVFGRFLSNTYLDKIQSDFTDEKVKYVGEDMLSNNRVVVLTNIIRNGVETPVNYNMFKEGGLWKIYDVKIEGVSLLKNYRSQFTSILLREKPRDLIEMLKKKLK